MKNINTEWTIDQVNATAPKREQLINSRVFVRGHEVPELSKDRIFPDGNKMLDCNCDMITDAVNESLDPIHEFIMQFAGNVSQETGVQEINDMIDILVTLEYAARKRLSGFIDDMRKNIGIPSIRRVGYLNKGVSNYRPEQAVAVEFLQYGEVQS